MKKNGLKNETEKPFGDVGYRRGSGFLLNKDRNDLAFKQYIELYIKNTALDSEKIRVLLFCYENNRLDQCLQELYEGGHISRKERELFIIAETVGHSEIDRDEFLRNPKQVLGGFKAVSCLVRANPNAIEFPFVQTAMANLIKLYRDITIQRKSPDKLLEDLKEVWDSFLPSRQGGNIPYRKNDLQRLIDIGIKQGHTKTDAIEIISDNLNISTEKLNSILRVKNTKGRPKKIVNFS